MLPYPVGVRRALVVLCCSPVPASVPIFTDELGEDVGLASTYSSFAIITSIIMIVSSLLIML